MKVPVRILQVVYSFFMFFYSIPAKKVETKTYNDKYRPKFHRICDYCGKRILYKCALVTHLQRHTNPPTHKCKACRKSFHTSSDLDRHALIHKDLKSIRNTYPCPSCSKVFKRRDQLRQHSETHQTREKVECKICHKLMQKRNLSQHLKEHQNLREHLCPYCNKGFNRGYAKKRHIEKTHFRERSYVA